MTETLTKKVESFNTARKNNKGFSLVELIIVIAIIAILAAVLAPQFIRFLDDAEVSTDIAKATNIETVINTLLASGDIEFGATNATFTWDVSAGTIQLGAGIYNGTAGAPGLLAAANIMNAQLNVNGTVAVDTITSVSELTAQSAGSTNGASDVQWTVAEDANGIVTVTSNEDYSAWN